MKIMQRLWLTHFKNVASYDAKRSLIQATNIDIDLKLQTDRKKAMIIFFFSTTAQKNQWRNHDLKTRH